MNFRPTVNATIKIQNQEFVFCEHPAAKGMPYGQSGRRATVYQIKDSFNTLKAVKIFTQTYRSSRNAEMVERLAPIADLPGLQVSQRIVLTPENHAELIEQYENLAYAVVMLWVYGETWQELILSGKELNQEQSFFLARAFTQVLVEMEKINIAHGDLSGPNVLLPGLHPFTSSSTTAQGRGNPIALVDVEDMYIPSVPMPTVLPGGSAGYAHRSSAQGVWAPEGDRFAGAVILAEMLGWCDASVRNIAYGEQYFDLNECQENTERVQILTKVLQTKFNVELANLFSKAWFSSTLMDCPTFQEWEQCLGEQHEMIEDVFPKETQSTVGQTISPQAASPLSLLVQQTIERGKLYLEVGQPEKAIKEFEEAYHLSPEVGGKELAKSLLQVAEGKERSGNLVGALTDYQYARSVAPPGGIRDELNVIITEINHKIELAQKAIPASPEQTAAVIQGLSLPQAQVRPPTPLPSEKSNKTMLIVAAVVAIVLIIVCLVMGFIALNPFQPTANPTTNTTVPAVEGVEIEEDIVQTIQLPENTTEINDDFTSKTYAWYEGTDEFSARGYENGTYYIHLYKPSVLRLAAPSMNFKPDNISFVAVIPQNFQGANMGRFGAFCRHKDVGNFSAVEINPNSGEYSLYRYVNHQPTFYSNPQWKKSPLVTNTPITIKLECALGSMAFSVNEQFVDRVADISTESGGVGVLVASSKNLGAQGFKVVFENFHAWKTSP